jgi:hypothetical protein
MANLLSLSSGASVVLTVTDGQSIVLNNGPTDRARLEITTGRGAGTVVTASHNGRREYGPFSAGTITLAATSGLLRYELSGDAISQLDDDAQPLSSAENQSVRSFVAGGGNRRVLRTVAIIGDSLSVAGVNPALPAGVGAFDCTGLSNLNSVGTWIVNPSFDGRGASGTAGTLSTDGAGRLQWQWNSDSGPGAWVDVSGGGFFEIPSLTPQRNMYVSVIRDYQRGTATSDTLTTSGIAKRAFGPSHTYSEILRDVLGTGVSVTSYGISGDLVGNFAARWRQAVANGPVDALVVLIGTNNSPATVAAAQANAAITIAALREMSGSASRIYVGGLFPRTDAASATRNAQTTYSDLLRAFCTANPQYRYWDAWQTLVSGSATDGTLKSGAYHTDNLHLMPWGAWQAKNVILAALSDDWSLPMPSDGGRGYVAWDNVSRTGSINANPRLKGSGGTGSGSGGVSGTVPANWTITRSAGTQTCALTTVTNADDQDSLVLTLAASTSAANNATSEQHELTQTTSLPSGLGAGNFVTAELDMEIQQADLLQKLEAVVISNGNTQSAYWGLSSRTWSNFSGTTAHRVRVRFERLLIVSGVTNFTIRLRMGTASGGSAVIAIRRFELLEA